jgi:hypothetical protein
MPAEKTELHGLAANFDSLEYRARPVEIESYTPRSTLTLPLSDAASRALFVEAEMEGLPIEVVAGRLLDVWARRQFGVAAALTRALESPVVNDRVTEKDLERRLAQLLAAAGIPATCQVDTGAGIADLVTPHAVVEVKLRITSWRELHQACGQAQAYCDALGASVCIVTADFIAPKLLLKELPGVEVLSFDRAVERLIQLGD